MKLSISKHDSFPVYSFWYILPSKCQGILSLRANKEFNWIFTALFRNSGVNILRLEIVLSIKPGNYCTQQFCIKWVSKPCSTNWTLTCSLFRFNHETDEVTITTDRCPYRGQNLDYAQYLVTALFHESWKIEPWEQKEHMDKEEFETEEGEMDEYTRTLQRILNEGEDEQTLREYKESARKRLDLPPLTVIPQIVSN